MNYNVSLDRFKPNNWEFVSNGKNFSAKILELNSSKDLLIVEINNKTFEFQFPKHVWTLDANFPFEIEGHEFFLNIQPNGAFSAKCGIYENNINVIDGKVYKPLTNFPKWGLIFWLLNLPIVFAEGTAPTILSACGIILTSSVGRNKKLSTATKVLLNILITAVIWAVFYIKFGGF